MPERLVKNLADGFAFGILTDLVGAMNPDSPPDAALGWLAGPAIDDVSRLGGHW